VKTEVPAHRDQAVFLEVCGPAARREPRVRAGSAADPGRAATRRGRSIPPPRPRRARSVARGISVPTQSRSAAVRREKKKDDQRPRGPIPVKTDHRSYSLEDDSPDVKLDDFDDFATSKPGLEPDGEE